MPELILLDQQGYQNKINSMKSAGDNLTLNVKKPEITGEMPALEKYISTYESLRNAMSEYKKLIQEDVYRLKSVQTEMTFAESQIIKG